ncbi:MAG: Ig-like domain-containing protein [Firmicutes bacterium]|nr:Ig-like domain-containing protein [Bacillota bacterium]
MLLTDYLTEIADAIRIKDGTTELINADDFAQRILDIPVNKVSQSGLSFTACEKINEDWQFKLITSSPTYNGYDSEAAQSALSGNDFISVNLPHDWSIYNDFNNTSKATYEGGYLDGGDAWYKKTLTITDDTTDNRYFLYFEGVYMESDVIVNGTHLIAHKHGYTNFIVEITDVIRLNEANEILVYVKNRQPSSRWYSGSGIYRDVFLLKSGKVGFKQQSIKVTTPNLEAEHKLGYCNTNVEYVVENTTDKTSTVTVEAIIKYFGMEILKKSFAVSIDANSEVTKEFTALVSDPKLWDEYDGQYYTLTLNMYNLDDKAISSSETYYGYRYFKFDPNTGFWLNGKNIKLRGACMHHDLGCLGAEVNQSAIDRQILKLKNAGFNAIRLTHNPSCAEFTNACMRMGIMCIEEAFDCWTLKKKIYDYARFFLEYAESDIKSMVKRSLNNPCVIAWSLGNEIYDTRSDNSSKVLQDPIITVKNLRNWVREIDTTRPCTMGENGIFDSTAQLVADVLDVQGFNYGNSHLSMHNTYPDWCIYSSETTSAISSRCVYERDDTNYQCSSYDDDKVSWGDYAYNQINKTMSNDYISGMFIWTGWDYIGEPSPFNKYPCRSSYFGIIDIAGFPKDSYYLYQSMWTDKPMCHIVPMDWSKWTVGKEVNVMVYSNASYVKMYLNGELVGTYNNKNISDATSKGSFYGTIPFQKGRLVANAYDTNDNLIAQDVIYTADVANKLSLKSEKLYYKDSDDLLFVEVDVCDKYNNVCTFANNTISVEVQNGVVIGLDNGDATSVLPYRSSTKPVFHGKLVCVVKPNNNVNNVTITAKSDGLIDGSITVNKSDMTVYTKEEKVFIDATEFYEFIGTEYPCESISLNASSVTFTSESSTYQLIPTVTPDNCTDIISYETSNNSVAIVDNNGLITSVNDGNCEIIVTCGSQTAICSVIVENVSVDCDTITLSETSITLTDKSQHDITATITPENCTYEVSWSSEDDSVVTIDNGGHMTAVADGTTNIIATCGSKSASCSVIVSLKNQPASDWTVEWNGETDSLPVGMTANENCIFVLNDTTGKYELTTPESATEAKVLIDDSVGKGILEVEFESSNFKTGSGWHNGLTLCVVSGYRQVLYTDMSASPNERNVLFINKYTGKTTVSLNTGETYKLRLDNTAYNEPGVYKGVDAYVNDELIYSDSETFGTDSKTVSSNVWTTSADSRIKAIRYKKITE